MCTKDFLGNIIEVGDKVVFIAVYYRNLKIGTVTKITPHGVKVKDSKGRLFQRDSSRIFLVKE